MTVQVDRMDNGEPRRYTSIGCYPLFYVTHKNDVLCPACAAEAEKGDDPPVACDANWEDPDMYCDDCGARIESAYAED